MKHTHTYLFDSSAHHVGVSRRKMCQHTTSVNSLPPKRIMLQIQHFLSQTSLLTTDNHLVSSSKKWFLSIPLIGLRVSWLSFKKTNTECSWNHNSLLIFSLTRSSSCHITPTGSYQSHSATQQPTLFQSHSATQQPRLLSEPLSHPTTYSFSEPPTFCEENGITLV